jgi:hypothetical protein
MAGGDAEGGGGGDEENGDQRHSSSAVTKRNFGRWVRGNKYGVIYEQVRRDFDGEGINCHQIRPECLHSDTYITM